MKKPWTSKTLWLNLLALACYLGKTALGVEQLPDVDPALLATANFLLRWVTSKPLGV